MLALKRLLGRFAGGRPGPQGAERRQSSRESIDCLAVVKTGSRSFTVQLQNLSSSGALLSPRLDVPAQTYVSIGMPEARLTLRACIVRHNSLGTGVSFADPTAVQALRDHLDID